MTAWLLDLDRTLVDVQTYTDYAAALEEVRELVAAWPDADTPDTGWDAPTRACMGVLVSLSGDPRWEEVSEVIQRHELAALPQATPMPGFDELAAAVGDRPVAVVTLLGPDATRRVLSEHGFPAAQLVPRRADLRPKPAPDQLLEGCRMLGVEPGEATMVGDSTWDREAARAAGTGFIGVTNRGPSEFPDGTETVTDLTELVARLDG